HRARVDALALGATYADWLRSKKAGPEILVDLVLALGRRAGPRRLARLLVSDDFARNNPGELAAFFRRGGLIAPAAAVRQMIAVPPPPPIDRLASLDVPTLVLSGAADRLVPVTNSRVLARRIPRARLLELAGAGHVFPFEREDDTVRALVDHFTEHTRT